MASINTNFINFLEKGIKAYSKKNTLDTLGDRSTYIGSSDIGQCPRKVYLSKKSPVEHTLQQEIIFARGHNAEQIIASAMVGNGINFEEQVEAIGTGDKAFIRTHIDFLIKSGKEMVVVECKSTGAVPSEPYASWIFQVQLQMGLLREGNPPIDCNRAVIVVVNVNTGENTAFDVPFDETLYQMAINKAKLHWEALQSDTEPMGKVESLCAFCPYKANCPALHQGCDELPLDLEQDAVEFVAIQSQVKALSKTADSLKAKLSDFMGTVGLKKVKVGEHSISYTQMNGRSGIDTKALQTAYPDIFEEFKTVGKPYPVLKIS